ncbi:MAG: HD domain-containing protein [Thermoleophilaceae bacterium]|nr:HD domain-containing protein [Thermoleophilaceae bacterium]
MSELEAGGQPRIDETQLLRAELEDTRRLAAEKEQQLERYASDLRETFKQERERTHEVRRSYVATVRALTNAVEARDPDTGKHAERVAAYSLELARSVAPELVADPLSEFGFLLHDVGKVAIPDSVLHKPHPLTAEERALIETHTVIGAQILAGIEFLSDARAVVRHHHERWDGGGYPDGLAGEDIPIAARIFAVADTFDALTTDRPYRPAATLERAQEVIAGEAGLQFDPAVVAAFAKVSGERLEEIRRAIT